MCINGLSKFLGGWMGFFFLLLQSECRCKKGGMLKNCVSVKCPIILVGG
jgi:hypothetical protein